MVVFPNCKINLGLNIIRRRTDGYHDLETIFYPIPLTDILEIIPADDRKEDSFTKTGLPLPGESGDNLCLKALQLLRAEYPSIPPLQIHLHKVIPAGAGLGGGSSDAAHLLLKLNEKFSLGLTPMQLAPLALKLGSDCPFFLLNVPSFAQGRGEKLTAVVPILQGFELVLVNPRIHVSTAAAFKEIIPEVPVTPASKIIEQPVSTWKGLLKNDFERVVFSSNPEIAAIPKKLYEKGAVYAAMSGSGSSVFGIFEKAVQELPSFPQHYLVRRFSL